MTADAFAESYARDGTVRGDGYTGAWRAQDGALCLSYAETDEQCWSVAIDDAAMTLSTSSPTRSTRTRRTRRTPRAWR